MEYTKSRTYKRGKITVISVYVTEYQGYLTHILVPSAANDRFIEYSGLSKKSRRDSLMKARFQMASETNPKITAVVNRMNGDNPHVGESIIGNTIKILKEKMYLTFVPFPPKHLYASEKTAEKFDSQMKIYEEIIKSHGLQPPTVTINKGIPDGIILEHAKRK